MEPAASGASAPMASEPLASLACPILASGTAGSALEPTARWDRTCLAGPVTVCWPFSSPVSMYPALPHSFLFLCGHLPVPVSPLSLPSDITAACALFPNVNDLILIVLCQREKRFFPVFPLPTFPHASFPAFLYQSRAPFPCLS